jgi:hypothetical protein
MDWLKGVRGVHIEKNCTIRENGLAIGIGRAYSGFHRNAIGVLPHKVVRNRTACTDGKDSFSEGAHMAYRTVFIEKLVPAGTFRFAGIGMILC